MKRSLLTITTTMMISVIKMVVCKIERLTSGEIHLRTFDRTPNAMMRTFNSDCSDLQNDTRLNRM